MHISHKYISFTFTLLFLMMQSAHGMDTSIYPPEQRERIKTCIDLAKKYPTKELIKAETIKTIIGDAQNNPALQNNILDELDKDPVFLRRSVRQYITENQMQELEKSTKEFYTTLSQGDKQILKQCLSVKVATMALPGFLSRAFAYFCHHQAYIQRRQDFLPWRKVEFPIAPSLQIWLQEAAQEEENTNAMLQSFVIINVHKQPAQEQSEEIDLLKGFIEPRQQPHQDPDESIFKSFVMLDSKKQ